MTSEEMMKYLTTDRKLTNEHLELIAFVLKEQGEIAENEHESRREWMLEIFRKAGETNSRNTDYQF